MTKYNLIGVCDYRLDYLLRKIKAASNNIIVDNITGDKVRANCSSSSCERFTACKQRPKGRHIYRYMIEKRGYTVSLRAF